MNWQLAVEHPSSNNYQKLVCLFFILFIGVAGACNYSTNPRNPVPPNTPPTTAIAIIPTVVIPEFSVTPSVDLSPTPTPESTPEAGRSDCIDDMKILAAFGSVEDDQKRLLIAWPGEDYSLGWRIQNSGNCTWDSAYSLELVENVQIAIEIDPAMRVLTERVTPGNSMTVQYEILAPLAPGDYPVSWILINGYRETVGEPLQAVIRVPGDAQDRPLPTATNNPNVQFEASSTQVAPYEKVVLSWEVNQANHVYFYMTGQAWVPNQVPLKGVRVYYPAQDTAYNLRVVNVNDTVESYKIEVIVEPPLGLPDIILFQLEPQGRLNLGGCVFINWRVRGGWATDVSLFENDVLVLADANRMGEYTTCPAQAGKKVYTLVASGPGGTARKSKTIYIQP